MSRVTLRNRGSFRFRRLRQREGLVESDQFPEHEFNPSLLINLYSMGREPLQFVPDDWEAREQEFEPQFRVPGGEWAAL
jgi:hypothetical protein